MRCKTITDEIQRQNENRKSITENGNYWDHESGLNREIPFAPSRDKDERSGVNEKKFRQRIPDHRLLQFRYVELGSRRVRPRVITSPTAGYIDGSQISRGCMRNS